MAGQQWDWFQREEMIGQISDMRVQNLQVERENVQKRTFTRWINLHLEKCSPPLEVKDLFVDIKDGKILMALLEVLSGQNLLHEYKPSTHRIFRLNNIAKALKFLEDSNVKLVSIDAAEIADGNSSMVLGLIWNVILFFQIKELTGNLNRNSSSSSLSSGPSGPDSDTSHPSTPNVERSMSVSVKDQRKAIKALLTWVQRKTRKYGVAVQDFTSSWRSGLAFLAIIKAIDSSLVDIKQALDKSSRENLEDAFTIAQDHLGIPRLLEPEDIMVESPDEQSVVTYIAQFLEHFPELEGEDFSDPDKEFPIESTYVHVKDTPGEEKPEKILILNENGGHAYTTHWDRSQSPPPKIHVLGLPLDQEDQNLYTANKLHDNLHQSLSDDSETLTELLHSEDPQRPTSLPVIESVGFQSSPVTNILADKLNGPEGHPVNTHDSPKKNDELPPKVLVNSGKYFIDPFGSSEDSAQESLDGKTCSLPQASYESGLRKESVQPPSGSPVEQTANQYVLQMLHEEIAKLPETLYSGDLEAETSNFTDNSETSLPSPSERLSLPIRNTPKSLDITNEGTSLPRMITNSSKVSVIPHDLFYYPHYDVPISEVLDAFAAPGMDSSLSENNKICPEVLGNSLAEKESLALTHNEAHLKLGQSANAEVSPTPTDDKILGKQKKNSCSLTKSSLNNSEVTVVGKSAVPKAKSNVTSSQKDSTRSDVPAIVVNQFDTTVAPEERKTTEERTKRKEKRKNKAIFQGENAQGAKAGSTRLLDKLEEDSADHQGLSRACHSDPNVVFQRTTDSASKESGSTDEQKSVAASESLTSTRKRKGLEKDGPDKAVPQSSTSRSDQPELFYFIIFLWVLVYCLLLLPQLISSSL
ncbi:calmin [Eublepharis macularius]|uniref:Calmin n=1 Tax=Eublepharis macularius TaxID=481883 RepID=A0AA97IXG2_EUBMA|nr:calmin [Eublepharis macularius]